jgi:hypothetical protein
MDLSNDLMARQRRAFADVGAYRRRGVFGYAFVKILALRGARAFALRLPEI